MLFNIWNLLPQLACVLAIGQIAACAPHRDPSDTDHGLEKRINKPDGMEYNVASGAYTKISGPGKYHTMARALSELYFKRYTEANPHWSGPLLISSLYVPEAGFFVSTRATRLLPTGSAPDWARAVHGRKHVENKGTQHVEDAALWLYESTLAAEKKPHANGKYPAGSLMYTYGVFAQGQKPQLVKACGSQGNSNLIKPSCTEVLTILGVKDGNNECHNP